MQKKAMKKMRLSRETLRVLSDEQTRDAAAGYNTQTCTNTQGATCYTCGNIPGAGLRIVNCV